MLAVCQPGFTAFAGNLTHTHTHVDVTLLILKAQHLDYPPNEKKTSKTDRINESQEK